MNLQTDDQTLEDLKIFGQRDMQGIYDLYNHTHTKGGQLVLEEFFRKPLCNMDEINQRSAIISGLARLKLDFPLQAAIFDISEKYLQQLPGQFAQSEKEIYNGVSAIIQLMRHLQDFIGLAEVKAIQAYADEREAILVLLEDAAFEPVRNENLKLKLAYGAVTAYDLLFRTRETAKIENLMQYIYRLDVYISVAKVAVDRSFKFPQALEKGTGQLKLEGLYHPSLKVPIGNKIVLDRDSNLIFLTGANMAGKSTFLRALGTAIYIAHIGFPVAATMMKFSVLDGIYTTINLPDDLGIGASHFFAEVLRVKKIAAELSRGRSLLVIFDELFRGTNVKDAHEGTVAICRALSRNKKSLFVISSHIVEVGDELKKQSGIAFRYLPTFMKGHEPTYTYTLKEGITEDRHGMMIIRNEGIVEILKNGRKK